ncbi:MAG: papain-like cysteine protease family protein [Patescibacteria group bacterium]
MEINHISFLRNLDRLVLRLETSLKGVTFPGLKRVKQTTSSHCGPATLVSLFSFLGVRTSQARIVRSLRAGNKIKDTGLIIKDLARAVRIVGKGEFIFWKKENATVGDLDKIINKFKVPVGAEWQGVFYEDEEGDNGHYCVITGVNRPKGYLKLADPYKRFAGLDRKFRISDFESRWWDSNEVPVPYSKIKKLVYDRKLMFLITPKKETFPRSLGMTRVN